MEPDTDLEYDLAHDTSGQTPPVGPVESAEELVTVVTDTPLYDGGDYSYDLAHDVPGR